MRWFILDLKKKRRKCGFDCLICLRTLFSASWGKFSPFITLVMACWFNLPRGFFQKAFSIFGMWWWHNSDFFDVPMSPSFHYLCRTWSREETELTILSWGHSCFPAPLPVAPFFLISPPLFRSWRHGRAGRGPLLPGSSGFDSLSWGEAWAFLPAEPWAGTDRGMGSDAGDGLRPPRQGSEGLGRAPGWNGCGAAGSRTCQSIAFLCCAAVLWSLHLVQDKSLGSLLPRIETLIPNCLGWAQQACFQSKACSLWVNFPFNFFLKILQQMALNAVSVCNCSFWCISHNEP